MLKETGGRSGNADAAKYYNVPYIHAKARDESRMFRKRSDEALFLFFCQKREVSTYVYIPRSGEKTPSTAKGGPPPSGMEA
jgi:hypothetical protein